MRTKKHKIYVPRQFCCHQLLCPVVELAPLAAISDLGKFSRLYCTANEDLLQFCLQFYHTVEMKTKSMIKAQILDMMICRSSQGMPRSARHGQFQFISLALGTSILCGWPVCQMNCDSGLCPCCGVSRHLKLVFLDFGTESQIPTQRYGRRPFGVGLLIAGYDVSWVFLWIQPNLYKLCKSTFKDIPSVLV